MTSLETLDHLDLGAPAQKDSSEYLFSPHGLATVRDWVACSPLLAFDYDGTLTPIVSNPSDAHLPASTHQLLERLSQAFCVCVISGRSQSDVANRLPRSLAAVVGNHGIEGLGLQAESNEDTTHRQLIAEWLPILQSTLSKEQGIVIENKGLTLSIHYRGASNHAEARARILAAAQNLSPLPRVMSGKCVLNLLPASNQHKGTAVLRLMERQKKDRAIFVGDDVTDEDVFAMGDPRILSIRIGTEGDSHARFHLNSQTEMTRLLHLFLELTEETHPCTITA